MQTLLRSALPLYVVLATSGAAYAQDPPPQQDPQTQDVTGGRGGRAIEPVIRPYDRVITKDATSRTGVFGVHRIKDRLYYEIPKDRLGREFLHHYLESERKACEPYAWTMRTYYPGGTITPVGEMFRQPNLAATLRALAAAEKAALARGASRKEAIDAGRDAFYKGPIARDMTAAVREAGGVMTEDDLATYHTSVQLLGRIRGLLENVFVGIVFLFVVVMCVFVWIKQRRLDVKVDHLILDLSELEARLLDAGTGGDRLLES